MSNLTGKWDIVVHTFMGDQFAFHELNVENGNLTGQVVDKGNGAAAEIFDTSIEGEKFSYKFKIKIPIGNLEFKMEGELQGDKIKGFSKNSMGEFEFEGTRV